MSEQGPDRDTANDSERGSDGEGKREARLRLGGQTAPPQNAPDATGSLNDQQSLRVGPDFFEPVVTSLFFGEQMHDD